MVAEEISKFTAFCKRKSGIYIQSENTSTLMKSKHIGTKNCPWPCYASGGLASHHRGLGP
jgi:hypothetical protein